MTRAEVADWLARYEAAWRSAGTAAALDLFTADADYLLSPYEEPRVGHDAIAELWESERAGPDEVFSMSTEIVAVDGDTGVVRVEVGYGEPTNREYRDLWILRLAPDGRCTHFEEWPFSPGQPYRAPGT